MSANSVELVRALKAELKEARMSYADLARTLGLAEVLLEQLQPEQECAVVADKQPLLAAVCVQSQWRSRRSRRPIG